ncbi:histone deacetylase family protein [Synoicihabitans lomoniglobus]|uniref:Histone deacetylase n=1 Tax=Synoicihabitans lomoniglobus TaxID=2909285 RepID=A0AAF0CSW5_9BACT|nr:histone deacetylase [Opitutaceae bacterium LMO-M01]WED67445.1 histone deacetylase [Opitutaceae bacterium LMO-M01]
MDKFWRAEAMIRSAQSPGLRIEPVVPATRSQLRRIHTDAYLASIEQNTLPRPAAVRLGLPASAALLARSALEVGGTLGAMRAARDDGLACNLAGGTHHAFPDRGLGYCVLNDVAIAIAELRLTAPAARVFVIDTDAHQGNGTNGIFAADANVFTYSIHVGKNYPAEKTPGSLDVPLPRYVDGVDYLDQLEATLTPAFEAFAPEFVFWIAGADLHEHDRFGQMKLTTAHFAARDHQVLKIVTAGSVPTAVLYGGGYNRDRVMTARLHADTVLRVAQAAGTDRL